jgi:hypothetical protein
MSATLAIYVSVENGDRARDVLEHGTLIPFLQVHMNDLATKVIEDDDEDTVFV